MIFRDTFYGIALFCFIFGLYALLGGGELQSINIGGFAPPITADCEKRQAPASALRSWDNELLL